MKVILTLGSRKVPSESGLLPENTHDSDSAVYFYGKRKITILFKVQSISAFTLTSTS